MTVRRSLPADAAPIAEMEALCFSDPWSDEDILRNIEAGYTLCLTAEENGAPIGYLLSHALPPEAEILRIATHPQHRLRGGGHALMQEFLSHAADMGIAHIFLEVRSRGTAARALYRSHGFYETGARRAYYRDPIDDAILMQWDAPR